MCLAIANRSFSCLWSGIRPCLRGLSDEGNTLAGLLKSSVGRGL